MDNSKEQQSSDDRQVEDVDRADQSFDGVHSIDISSSGDETPSIARRLTEIFVENGDGDLLLQRSDREEGVLRWLQALDMQVMGACREDERLKPLLKLNVSTGVAEDRLLAHLSQHFEPSEVGMLARCLCIPLVSVRVGKINKEGTLLFPTSTRGNLCLTLLPTSDLRISFNGDDGSIERLATFSSMAQSTAIEIEEISSDKSGRSFSINISDTLLSYFWCCEKSKLMGTELLRSMNDLLTRRPSLSELTGISESRLNCFATHLRAYLVGSTKTTHPHPPPDNCSSKNHFSQSSSCVRNYSSQGPNTNLTYHGCSSLSPRSKTPFKEGPPKNLSFIRIASREKLKRQTEVADPCSSSKRLEKEKPPEATKSHSLSFLDSLPEIHVPFSGTSNFSPQYCLCPVASAIQYGKANLQLPTPSTESLSLPTFSSQKITEIPPLVTTSQQIPTFTPLMCDPIIHIPVIDVCSSGQGYLVTAGPAMSTVISPLNTNLMDPLHPNNNESALEKGARETLRMLINNSSNHSNSQILDSLPSVLSSNETRMTSMGLVLLSEKSMGSGVSIGKRWGSREDLNDQKEKKSSFDEGLD